MKIASCLLPTLLVTGLAPISAQAADSYHLRSTLTAQSPVSNGFFGNSVSLSSDGQTALLGESGANRAFIYMQSQGTWVVAAEIDDPGSAASDGFGIVAVISGDGRTAAICDDKSHAYIYSDKSGSWTHVTTLSDPGSSSSDNFCAEDHPVSISTDGGTLIIGADQTTVSGQSGAGSAYVYKDMGGTWSAPVAITQPGGAVANGDFGDGVAVSGDGDYVLIGDAFNASPSASLFHLQAGNWVLSHTFTSPASSNPNLYGLVVALSAHATRAVIAAPGSAVMGTVYIYSRNSSTWSGPVSLHDPLNSSGNFGERFALSNDGDTLAISEEFADKIVYTRFSGSTWSGIVAISGQPKDPTHNVALSSDGTFLLVGAGGADAAGVSSGGEVAVYTFGPPPTSGTGGSGNGGGYSSGGGSLPGLMLMPLLWCLLRRKHLMG